MLWEFAKTVTLAGFAVYAIILIADMVTIALTKRDLFRARDPRDPKSGFQK